MAEARSRKIIVVVGGAIFLLAAVFHRRRSARRQKQCTAAAAADVARAQKHDSSVAEGMLPVDVNTRKLSSGWAAAPPLFYPAERRAVIPLVTPGESKSIEAEEARHSGSVCVPGAGGVAAEVGVGARDGCNQSAFILCEGPSHEVLEVSAAATVSVDGIVALLSKHPLLGAVCQQGQKGELSVVELDTTGQAAPFTHRATAGTTELLIGLHGPYLAVCVLSGFEATAATPENDGACIGNAVAAISAACSTTPFVVREDCGGGGGSAPFILEGTPAGAHAGQYRITVVQDDKTVVLMAPSDVTVRTEMMTGGGPAKSPAVVLAGFSEATGKPTSCILTGAVVKMIDTAGGSLVAACPALAAVAPEDVKALMAKIHVASVQSSQDRHAAEGQVTIVYTHPRLRAFFSVQGDTGIVEDPILTGSPQVLYHPLGAGADRPCMAIQEFPQFPAMWESAVADDDELVHNVRFHFTEWDRERTDCLVTELSGLRCVQFTEIKDSVRCRSYVVPRAKSILVIRCESPVAEFDTAMLQLQLFLDTLHVDA